ncbi:phosphatidylinositol phosphate synthase [Propionibacteriaceae bacterium Y1923]
MLERFRRGWGIVMTPPARLLLRAGLSPDVVTWAGTLLTVVAALVMLPQGWLWQATVVLTVLVSADSIDGQMARLSGRPTTWGAFLDSTLDRIADGALFMGVALYYAGPGESRLWAGAAMAALVLGQVTSYTKARGESLGVVVAGGLAARADRLVALGLGILLTGLATSGLLPGWLVWALPAALAWLVVAGAVTVAQRMAQVHAQTTSATG